MEDKRPGGKDGQGGFTLIELVVVIIVLAIIAKIAGPAWVDVKTDAGAKAAELTKDRLKVKWLAAKTGYDRGVSDPPTLGRIVGHKAAVPPAPATAPMLLDYSYSYFNTSSGPTVMQSWLFQAKDAWSYAGTSPVNFDNVDQVTCDNSFIVSHIPADAYYTANSLYKKLIGVSFTRVSGTENSVPVGSQVPKCRGTLTYYNGWCSGSGAGQCSSQISAQYSPYCFDGGAKCLYAPSTYTYTSLESNSNHYGWVRDFPANSWRMTCKGYESTYGVPYVISGYGMYAQDGKTVGSWFQVIFRNYYEISPIPNRINNLDGTPPTVGAAVCQRVGGPTAGNAEYLGDPPLALDYSGWCLGSGTTLKLPAYKDEAGTIPTSSYGDTVKAIGKAVSDPANCPAS